MWLIAESPLVGACVRLHLRPRLHPTMTPAHDIPRPTRTPPLRVYILELVSSSNVLNTEIQRVALTRTQSTRNLKEQGTKEYSTGFVIDSLSPRVILTGNTHVSHFKHSRNTRISKLQIRHSLTDCEEKLYSLSSSSHFNPEGFRRFTKSTFKQALILCDHREVLVLKPGKSSRFRNNI